MKPRASPSPAEIRAALERIAQHGIPARHLAWITDIGTESFLAFFNKEILDGLVLRGGATCRFFEAVYGGGKTHLLDLLETTAIRRGMAVVRTDLSQALSLEDWKMITHHVLERISLVVDGQEVRSLPLVLDAVKSRRDLNPEKLQMRQFPHAGFANAIHAALFGDRNSEAYNLLRRYLLGEPIGVGMLRKCLIRNVNDPLSTRNAEHVLATAVSALFQIGVPGIMMLFDENEKTLEIRTSTPSKKTQTAANLVRRLIDSCTTGGLNGVLAVFAVLPDFLKRCSLAYPALGQRLEVPSLVSERQPWRWPVTTVTASNDLGHSEDEFAERAVEKMLILARACGIQYGSLERRLRIAARTIVEEHVGTGFRRPLMRRLATITLQEMRF